LKVDALLGGMLASPDVRFEPSDRQREESMKNVARGVAVSVIALLGLVPVQASPAAALVGSLNVEPEKVVRIADSDHRVTATVSPAQAVTVVFDDDDNPLTTAPECTTDAGTGSCSILFDGQADGTTTTIRAYVEDGLPALPCPATAPATPDADCTEGQDETATPGTTPETPTPDDTDVVSVEWAEGYLDVEPETPTAAVAPGSTVTLKASLKSTETTARNLVGNVDAEIIPPNSPNVNKNPSTVDAECTTLQTTGSCDLTYLAGPNSGVDTVRSWADLNDDPEPPTDTETDGDETDPTNSDFEGDETEGVDETTTPGSEPETPTKDITDVVSVNISAAQVLSLGPPSQTKDVGTSATLTASVTLGGTPQNNIKVAASILTGGPNAGTVLTCTTGSGGTCPLAFTGGANTGTDKVRATVDTNGDGQPNEADATEDVGNNGGTAEPDTTAVASVTWVKPTPPPDGGGGGDDDACNAAKKKLKKAKAKLKKAKKSGDEEKIKKAKKKVKRAKKRRVAACAG
jgi:hypothetical protein